VSSASVSRAKSNWRAPIGDFIVSDDEDVDESDTDSDSDIGDALLLSNSDKENEPVSNMPDNSDGATQKSTHSVNAVNSDTTSGRDVFLKPGTVH